MMDRRRIAIYFAPVLLLGLVACQQKPPSLETVHAADTRPSAFPKQVVQIPAGSAFVVRLNQAIDTRSARNGQRFSASLDAPILVAEKSILPVGTPVTGHIISARSSGRLKGRGNQRSR